MINEVIEIESFNPFECQFPNRKLITRETLILIKNLRAAGHNVRILPDNNQPLEILYKKGFSELFSDVLFLYLCGKAVDVAVNVISSQVEKLLESGKNVKTENIIINIDRSTKIYNYLGEKVLTSTKKKLLEERLQFKQEFEKCFNTISPFHKYPIPIFLEHKPKIVGWCLIYEDEKGLGTEGIVTDKKVKRRISQGRLKGFSITGIAKLTQCSICKSKFTECNHIPGNMYDNKECLNKIIEADFIEGSIVKEPINPQCLINMQL
ncbi:hypothetical protein Q4534_01545 [Cyclobacterium sp. 1_MG-2023]|uniref:hypothetical protein n=1 Tax=Cyclobacterium sp. 1_MG-2023 TaxID=3062681 RepID=UPI0026E3C7E0|nr:hypothetical protein [Cyclobacterium sp. 1_MG-2023]MDO6436065.1 hypothetical protein [Cyclobacterium sp. 1_MG-2023]